MMWSARGFEGGLGVWTLSHASTCKLRFCSNLSLLHWGVTSLFEDELWEPSSDKVSTAFISRSSPDSPSTSSSCRSEKSSDVTKSQGAKLDHVVFGSVSQTSMRAHMYTYCFHTHRKQILCFKNWCKWGNHMTILSDQIESSFNSVGFSRRAITNLQHG